MYPMNMEIMTGYQYYPLQNIDINTGIYGRLPSVGLEFTNVFRSLDLSGIVIPYDIYKVRLYSDTIKHIEEYLDSETSKHLRFESHWIN